MSGTEKKPGDVYLPAWFLGCDAALDVTVITPIQDDIIVRASQKGGVAADIAHKRKLAKYYNDCKSVAVEFLPLAVETWGGWHTEALSTLKTLSKQLARQQGKDENETQRHTFQRLSILLQKGNVSLLTARVPDFCCPEVDGDLDLDI